MKLYVINPRVFLRNNRLIALFAVTFICILLLTPSVGISSATNTAKGSKGPTMIMRYSEEKFVKNPIASFAYFVPLIAPTLVDNISSFNNEQQVAIISHKITADSKSFHVTCEFEILGSGFHMNTFDSSGMITTQTGELKKGKAMTNMLDYIKFDGDGFGIIEVKGTINDSAMIVTEVDIKFDARGHNSPVTIGLYDIKPKDGEYKYENRSNEAVARVNTLSFKKTEDDNPRMGIKVASISGKTESGGFFSVLKGKIANLLIKPPKVDKLGNTTMLEFGYALLQKNTTFTFPKAKNIKESKIVEIDHIKNKIWP
ncbi:MAG: hypothetical protein A2031_00140 [Deltaproteobacteria bacterium RBG_19FT_COMBO_43_11]|nr:MAG: hypothetical protein A2W27_05875 [Deltaproteobacteria bacterium RBG_16_44_11]OGP88435.1 MAG: hypothetical protein A2031_00140 [Deltaproteobacteria bacterium RBG_19FT_COMBO_43_11]